MSTWKGDPFGIPFELAKSAMQDYAIACSTLQSILGSSRTDDYKLYRYWYGLRFQEEGKITYYPTASEIDFAHIVGFDRVVLEDGSKEGTVVHLLDYQDTPINQPNSVIYKVQVDWDDGTTSLEPYSGIRHVTPQGVGSCRMQSVLGAYKGGVSNIEEKPYTDILEKVAAMMVAVAFTVRFHGGGDENDYVNAICEMSASTQQKANLTLAYETFREVDLTTSLVTAYGWGADSGMKELRQMWAYVRNPAKTKNVADWATWPAKFVDKVEVYGIGECRDTGLVVCPMCKLCEKITDANFVDFGVYFGADSNSLTSYTYKVSDVQGNNVYRALGIVNCNGCSTSYYRKFNPVMRREREQMPIGEGELIQRKPYTTQWIIRSIGYGAKVGEVRGYSFLPHNSGQLPTLRIFLYYAGRVMAIDYPLEVGAMGRVGQRDTLCTGASLVESSGMKSHKYYDRTYAPPYYDGSSGEYIPQLGKGVYAGDNTSDFTNTDPLTRLKLCDWCDKVGVPTTLSESKTYSGGSRSWMVIDRDDGSQLFDRLDKDYFIDSRGAITYKLRLVSPAGNRIRFLETKADDMGVLLPNTPPTITPQINGNVCENDLWVKTMFDLIDEYAQDLQTKLGLKSESLACRGLAWSARYDVNQNGWLPSKPPTSWLGSSLGITHPDGIEDEIDENTWEDGENQLLHDGEERFPAAKCAGIVSYVSPYSSCMNTQGISPTHEIEVVSVEDEQVTTTAGDVTKRITHLWCRTCEESFIGAPDDSSATTFVIPHSTDPHNTPERTGEEGEYSIFNEDYRWHFTHSLYPPKNMSMETLAKSATHGDALRRAIPRKIFQWLLNGKTFNRSTSDTDSEGDDED